MTFETQFEIGQKVRATRSNAYVEFEIDQVKIETLASGHFTLIQYRCADSNGKHGIWYAEKELSHLASGAKA